MNIREIDLLGLKKLVLSKEKLSDEKVKLIDKIMWSVEQQLPETCDVIMVPGFPKCVEERLPKALELFTMYNHSPWLLLTGGGLINDLGITEAEAMKNAAVLSDIAESRILVETSSKTTQENIINSAPVLAHAVGACPKIIITSSATHLRRIWMNFQKYGYLYPEGFTVYPVSSDQSDRSAFTRLADPEIRRTVAIELGFIHEYIYELEFADFDI